MARKQANLTPWFPGSVKPKRKGIYVTQYMSDAEGFSYWSGKGWASTGSTKGKAVQNARLWPEPNHYTQSKRWRGLAEAPK